MKTRIMLFPLFAGLLLAGCGQQNGSSAGSSGASAAPAGPREIDITANDTMHYDITSMTAKPRRAAQGGPDQCG